MRLLKEEEMKQTQSKMVEVKMVEVEEGTYYGEMMERENLKFENEQLYQRLGIMRRQRNRYKRNYMESLKFLGEVLNKSIDKK